MTECDVRQGGALVRKACVGPSGVSCPTTHMQSKLAGRNGGCARRRSACRSIPADRSTTCSTCSRTRVGAGLHVGHPKGYTATDVVARCEADARLQRAAPDGLGRVRPARRAGAPCARTSTPRSITQAQHRQLQEPDPAPRLRVRLGARALDDRRPTTTNWTQWIFLKLYEKGLAYQAEVAVNWCPALGTVLANEEVQDGRYVETGDRSREALNAAVDAEDHCLCGAITRRISTISTGPNPSRRCSATGSGRVDGAEVTFQVDGARPGPIRFVVFTTRPDTLFGATYLRARAGASARHADHDARAARARSRRTLRPRANRANAIGWREAKEKTGVFTGAFALNPGHSAKPIPVWIADYVLCELRHGRDHGRARPRRARLRVRARLSTCRSSRS